MNIKVINKMVISFVLSSAFICATVAMNNTTFANEAFLQIEKKTELSQGETYVIVTPDEGDQSNKFDLSDKEVDLLKQILCLSNIVVENLKNLQNATENASVRLSQLRLERATIIENFSITYQEAKKALRTSAIDIIEKDKALADNIIYIFGRIM